MGRFSSSRSGELPILGPVRISGLLQPSFDTRSGIEEIDPLPKITVVGALKAKPFIL
jgi:hypothetical protein